MFIRQKERGFANINGGAECQYEALRRVKEHDGGREAKKRAVATEATFGHPPSAHFATATARSTPQADLKKVER